MLHVRGPSFRDLVTGRHQIHISMAEQDTTSFLEQGIYIPKSMLYRNFINPFNVVIFVIFSAFILSFFEVSFLSLSIGLSGYLTLTYFHLKNSAHDITLKRDISKDMFTEGDEFEVAIQVKNNTRGWLQRILIYDHFDGTAQPTSFFLLNGGIRPGTTQVLKYKKKCNVGMGEYRFKSLGASIADPLGLFHFQVIDDASLDVYVGPKIQDLREMIFKPSQSSRGFGQHETMARGENVNFEGVRDYERGDPLRHIAWKLSARQGELFVKTFENQVNIDVTFFLELHPHLQLGFQSFSTWEYMRDITISMMTQLVRSGEKFQLITNNLYVPFGSGKNHMYFIGRNLATMLSEERILEENTEEKIMLPWYQGYLPPESILFYCVPYLPTVEGAIVDSLAHLHQRGMSIIVVLIDAQSIVEKMPMDSRRVINLYNMHGNYKRDIREFGLYLQSLGIDSHLGQFSAAYWDSIRPLRRGQLYV